MVTSTKTYRKRVSAPSAALRKFLLDPYSNLFYVTYVTEYVAIYKHSCYKYIPRERYTRLLSSLARFRPLITFDTKTLGPYVR